MPRQSKNKRRDTNVLASQIVKQATGGDRTDIGDKNPAAVALGKLGGLKRTKQLTPKQRKELAQKAARARWNKGVT